MTLSEFKSELLEVTTNLFHYTAPPTTSVPYVIWAEDSRLDFLADGVHAEKMWQGTIDLYTRTENDPLADDIEDCLDDLRIGWYLNSVQFEEDTGVIHYEWVWSV